MFCVCFSRYALGLSSGIEDMGPIRWQLWLSLLAAWIIVFLCICKGVKSSGKVGEKLVVAVGTELFQIFAPHTLGLQYSVNVGEKLVVWNS